MNTKSAETKVLLMIYVPQRNNSVPLAAVLHRRGERDFEEGCEDPQAGVFHATVCGWLDSNEDFSTGFSRLVEETLGRAVSLRNVDVENPSYHLCSKGIVSEVFEVEVVSNVRCFVAVVPYEQFLKIRLPVSSGGLRTVYETEVITHMDQGVSVSETTAMNSDSVRLLEHGFKKFVQTQTVAY